MALPRPHGNRILVKPYEKPDTNPDGVILIPDAYKSDPSGMLYEVLAIGTGRVSKKGVRIPITDIKVDDIVQADRFSAEELALDNQLDNVYTIHYDHVHAVIGRIERAPC